MPNSRLGRNSVASHMVDLLLAVFLRMDLVLFSNFVAVVLPHLAVNIACPVLPSVRLVLFARHVCEVGHAAEALIGVGCGPEAVVPFALRVADGGDVPGRGVRSRAGAGLRGGRWVS